MTEPTLTVEVRVWDLPTRVFHWLLALAVIALVITGKIGDSALAWHMRIGLAVGALLAFRLVWGLVGGRWSRFASFVYAPGTVLRYLKGERRPGDHFEVGHNPLGSFSVFAMLGLLMVQVGTGTLADDEVATVGPLNKYVSTATGLAATGWHKGWGQKLVIVLVVLHLCAVAYYRFKGSNLVRPMVSGDKTLSAAVPAAADTPATRLLALVVVALCAAAAVWVARQGG